ncbi:hypothetical protein NEOKW01_2086 [Nematocida sp. AWRm80]|nr:hypothetical protein NEOKW01_2086 [Nematocida sp. AWRm80]
MNIIESSTQTKRPLLKTYRSLISVLVVAPIEYVKESDECTRYMKNKVQTWITRNTTEGDQEELERILIKYQRERIDTVVVIGLSLTHLSSRLLNSRHISRVTLQRIKYHNKIKEDIKYKDKYKEDSLSNWSDIVFSEIEFSDVIKLLSVSKCEGICSIILERIQGRMTVNDLSEAKLNNLYSLRILDCNDVWICRLLEMFPKLETLVIEGPPDRVKVEEEFIEKDLPNIRRVYIPFWLYNRNINSLSWPSTKEELTIRIVLYPNASSIQASIKRQSTTKEDYIYAWKDKGTPNTSASRTETIDYSTDIVNKTETTETRDTNSGLVYKDTKKEWNETKNINNKEEERESIEKEPFYNRIMSLIKRYNEDYNEDDNADDNDIQLDRKINDILDWNNTFSSDSISDKSSFLFKTEKQEKKIEQECKREKSCGCSKCFRKLPLSNKLESYAIGAVDSCPCTQIDCSDETSDIYRKKDINDVIHSNFSNECYLRTDSRFGTKCKGHLCVMYGMVYKAKEQRITITMSTDAINAQLDTLLDPFTEKQIVKGFLLYRTQRNRPLFFWGTRPLDIARHRINRLVAHIKAHSNKTKQRLFSKVSPPYLFVPITSNITIGPQSINTDKKDIPKDTYDTSSNSSNSTEDTSEYYQSNDEIDTIFTKDNRYRQKDIYSNLRYNDRSKSHPLYQPVDFQSKGCPTCNEQTCTKSIHREGLPINPQLIKECSCTFTDYGCIQYRIAKGIVHRIFHKTRYQQERKRKNRKKKYLDRLLPEKARLTIVEGKKTRTITSEKYIDLINRLAVVLQRITRLEIILPRHSTIQSFIYPVTSNIFTFLQMIFMTGMHISLLKRSLVHPFHVQICGDEWSLTGCRNMLRRNWYCDLANPIVYIVNGCYFSAWLNKDSILDQYNQPIPLPPIAHPSIFGTPKAQDHLTYPFTNIPTGMPIEECHYSHRNIYSHSAYRDRSQNKAHSSQEQEEKSRQKSILNRIIWYPKIISSLLASISHILSEGISFKSIISGSNVLHRETKETGAFVYLLNIILFYLLVPVLCSVYLVCRMIIDRVKALVRMVYQISTFPIRALIKGIRVLVNKEDLSVIGPRTCTKCKCAIRIDYNTGRLWKEKTKGSPWYTEVLQRPQKLPRTLGNIGRYGDVYHGYFVVLQCGHFICWLCADTLTLREYAQRSRNAKEEPLETSGSRNGLFEKFTEQKYINIKCIPCGSITMYHHIHLVDKPVHHLKQYRLPLKYTSISRHRIYLLSKWLRSISNCNMHILFLSVCSTPIGLVLISILGMLSYLILIYSYTGLSSLLRYIDSIENECIEYSCIGI